MILMPIKGTNNPYPRIRDYGAIMSAQKQGGNEHLCAQRDQKTIIKALEVTARMQMRVNVDS